MTAIEKHFKPKLMVRQQISRGRNLGALWVGLLPNGKTVSCGALRCGDGDTPFFSLDEALKGYRKHLNYGKGKRAT